ncbi:hypothetical protein [Paenirhodobacter populi]|nr:hypothetical protein [Sinirhodobacter populi]
MLPPDFSRLSPEELRTWSAVLRGAIAALQAAGGGARLRSWLMPKAYL